MFYNFLESDRLLTDDQFGFRQGRTVGKINKYKTAEDQLLLGYSVSSWVDYGYIVDVIQFDFTKAFDTRSHFVLLNKLNLLGIGGFLLN